ncbi:MAG TPA: DapH/DapD/GlmU-related protein, partial [Haloplasmataceae bacterium]
VIIEDGAFIGANAVILEGIRVGERAVVAAGAVVTKDVPPHQVVAGVPARIIKSRQALDTEKTKIVEELRG